MEIKSLIDKRNVNDIIYHACCAVRVFSDLPAEVFPDLQKSPKKGGFLTIIDRITGYKYLTVIIGEVPSNKMEKYAELSGEKAERLFRTFNELKHQSSWESRDPDNGKWGGAITAADLIISFSGLTEAGDEAVCLDIAYKLNWSNYNEITKIAENNNNPLFDPMHDKLN